MSQVAIEKVDGKMPSASPAFEEIKTLSEKIRQRAFELFARRGCTDGLAIDDWFRAEHELYRVPEAELTETDGKFQVLLNTPGYDGDVRFCEFDQKTLFRCFDFPEPIRRPKR